jgi:geranylgeranyl reductase family protein
VGIFDVIIAGAGPGGLAAAYALSGRGLSVLVLDRKRRVGEPLQCAEYIPALASRELPEVEGSLVRKIEKLRTFICDAPLALAPKIPFEPAGEMSSPGWMLDRRHLEKAMAREILRMGIEIRMETHVMRFAEEGLTVSSGRRTESLKARIYIGADGPRSIVGRGAGLMNTAFLRALQYSLPCRGTGDGTDVYFFRDVPGGYGWFFPKNDSANVGLGVSCALVRDGRSLKSLLDAFTRLLGYGKTTPLSVSGGFIPCGGPLEGIAGKSWILVGDAAGYADAITGGGLPQAVMMGSRAGRAAAEFLGGKAPALKEYREFCEDNFFAVLRRSAIKRREMERDWGASAFSALLRRSWPGFREYFR